MNPDQPLYAAMRPVVSFGKDTGLDRASPWIQTEIGETQLSWIHRFLWQGCLKSATAKALRINETFFQIDTNVLGLVWICWMVQISNAWRIFWWSIFWILVCHDIMYEWINLLPWKQSGKLMHQSYQIRISVAQILCELVDMLSNYSPIINSGH